ncbi:glycosyltransferase family 2 protein [Thermodesulfovibrionales bacterium]|nr:glycosyltransferase family 2 protein [Thermodesulfovibrionales bacterium]
MKEADMEAKQEVQSQEQEPKSWPRVAIIVLNWNGWQDTIECLESLRHVTYPNYQLIVVDNGSTDGSVKEIERWFVGCGGKAKNVSLDMVALAKQYASFEVAFTGFVPTSNKTAEVHSVLLESGSNLGYAGGNNVGLAWAIAEGCHYALILNNDATVEPEFVDRMVEVIRESKASVVGALVKDSPGGKVLFAKSSYPAMLFYSEPQQFIPDKEWWASDRVDGSAMFLCRELLLERWQSLGYFLDDSLFLYSEEIELALWCRRAGKRSVIAREAVVYHKVGASSGGKGTPLQFYYLTRNRVLLARRYLRGSLWFFFFATYPIWRIIRAGVYGARGKRKVALAILQGLFDGCKGKTGTRL